MLIRPVAPKTLPAPNAERVMLLSFRWERAASAMKSWADLAKKCVDFVEGRQWTADQIAKLESQGRPAFVYNEIAPLIRLVAGYQRNNRTDINFLPATDGYGTDAIADALEAVVKNVGHLNHLDYVDTEVFMDGIVTGRGFYDSRIDYTNNDFGEIVTRACDPFSVYIDPDGDEYDLNTCAYVQKSRWASIDEIEETFGGKAADAVKPYLAGDFREWGGFPTVLESGIGETTPVRNFGGMDDPDVPGFRDLFHTDFLDTRRKSVRVIESQHHVTEVRDVFIDLETGDKQPIPSPEEFHKMGKDRGQFIAKALYHAERLGNPLVVKPRPVTKVRWTVQVGDTLVFDDWSPYPRYTLDGFFPYFRRGYTQGMVSDLLDPQLDLNKNRAAEIEIKGRMGNPIWKYSDQTFTPEQERNLIENGSMAGARIKFKDGTKHEPEREDGIQSAGLFSKLGDQNRDDMRRISGINDSALGDLDRVQSGRAVEARQRQAVIALQIYMDNFNRTKELLGEKYLSLIQSHYTEERIFRVLGEDGKLATTIINQKQMDPVTGRWSRLNDVTLGKYTVTVSESPLSATFANAQFEEAMMLLEKLGPVGQALMQTRPDLLVDMSSMPRKEEWTEALRQAIGMMGPAMPGGGGGGGVPVDPGVAPEQGAALDQAAQPGGNVVQLPVTG